MYKTIFSNNFEFLSEIIPLTRSTVVISIPSIHLSLNVWKCSLKQSHKKTNDSKHKPWWCQDDLNWPQTNQLNIKKSKLKRGGNNEINDKHLDEIFHNNNL